MKVNVITDDSMGFISIVPVDIPLLSLTEAKHGVDGSLFYEEGDIIVSDIYSYTTSDFNQGCVHIELTKKMFVS